MVKTMNLRIIIMFILILSIMPISNAISNEYGFVNAWFDGKDASKATVENVNLKIGEPVDIKLEVTSNISGHVFVALTNPSVTVPYQVIEGSDIEKRVDNLNIQTGWSKTFTWKIKPNGAWTNGNAPINIFVKFHNIKSNDDKIIEYTIANPYILDEQYEVGNNDSTPILTPTPTPTPATTTPATSWQGKFRVGPTVTLRPVTDVIETNQDGIVDLFMNNPSLNDARLNVDIRISVPSGMHVYGESFTQAAGAGVAYGTFSLPPGTTKTIAVVIKADKSARIGSHTISFTGLYWPDENKDNYQPLSLTYSVNVKEPSEEPDNPPETPIPTYTVIPTITPTVNPSPIATSNLEQEVKELRERLNKTEEKQSQQESRISWLEYVINSIIDRIKSVF